MAFKIHNNAVSKITQLNQNINSINNNIDFLSINLKTMDSKGINIDDTTAVLNPISHNPLQPSDTFPHNWPGVNTNISAIRTFHYATGVAAKHWVRWAVDNDIKVIVGLTLGSDNAAAEINAFSADYMNADAALKSKYDANVIAIAVGNEQTDVSAMMTGIADVKSKQMSNNLPPAPVTSVLEFSPTWVNGAFPPQNGTFTSAFMTLESSLDIICFNCYGGYFNLGSLPPLTPQQDLERSLSWTSNSAEYSVLLNQFGCVRYSMATAMISKPFWCTETGWSSKSNPGNPDKLSGWSSIPHLTTFYQNFLGFSTTQTYFPQSSSPAIAPPEKIFFYAVRDVPPRPEYFGLYTTQASPLSQKV